MGQDRAKLKKGGRIWVPLIKSHQQEENHIIISGKGIGHYDKGLVLSGTHTPHEYQSLVYARFAYTPDPSHI
jgi:hypothetical protein